MRALVDRTEFAAALKAVTPAVLTKGLPILGGVRIEYLESALVLVCTNLDLTIEAVIDAEPAHAEPGVVIPPAGLLSRLVAPMAGATVELSLDDGRLSVISGETVVRLDVFDVDAWPKVHYADAEPVELGITDLDLIARCLPFTMSLAKAENALYSGVHFNGGRVMATEAHRAAVGSLSVEVDPVTIPAETIAVVMRSIGDTATLAADAQRATFTSDRLAWTVQLLEGQYPDLTKFMAVRPAHRLTFDRQTLADSVARLNPLGGPDVKIRIDGEGGKARLSAATDVGTVTDTIPCEGDYRTPLQFHGGYLADLIEAVGGDEIEMEIVDSTKPVIVRSDRFEQVLVPIALGPA